MSNDQSLDERLLRRTQETLATDVSLIASEFLAGFQAIQKIDRLAVSIFGSARVGEDSPTYEAARLTARLFAEAGLEQHSRGRIRLVRIHDPEPPGGRLRRLGGHAGRRAGNRRLPW